MHDDTLVNQFINDEDHTTHIADQTFSLKLVLEDLVEAFVDAVEHLSKNEFVVFRHAKNVN